MKNEIVGSYEAARIAGVSKSRFNYMINRAMVPVPFAKLRCGPIWLKSDIEEWAANRNRTPGRRIK